MKQSFFTTPYSDVARLFLRLMNLGAKRPDLEFLAELMRAFGKFPYENFTKIMRAREFDGEDRLRLPDIVFGEHVEFGAGGTCFSLTYFFEQVLKFAGYAVYPVLCDRSYGPDTHCALVAKIGKGNYLVDPGYLMEAPLLMPQRGETRQAGKDMATRLARLGESSQFLLYSELNGKAKLRYRLRDEKVGEDRFKKRWLDSFDWAMMRHPCISRMTEDGQLFMRDGVMRLSKKEWQAQRRVETDFAEKISKTFGINAKIVDGALGCVESGTIK